MANPLKTAMPPPPPRPVSRSGEPQPTLQAVPPAPKPKPVKFAQVKEDERVQFNKRVTRGVADGFEMLSIRARRRVPDLLAEALELLEDKYGKV